MRSKNFRNPSPAEVRAEPLIGSDSVILTATLLMKIVPHEGIHEFKMYNRDDEETVFIMAKHVENL